jgi:hypothetical protein
MNLVAKEYVACQIGDPGVLVFSRFAGASETMREALRVNPYHVEATADALHRALTMDEPERRSRMAALRWRERRADVGAWLELRRAAAAAPAGIRSADGGRVRELAGAAAHRSGDRSAARLRRNAGGDLRPPIEAQPTPAMRRAPRPASRATTCASRW